MQYLSVQEVEETTGISAATIRAMLREGLAVGFESGGRWVVPEDAVDQLMELAEGTEAAKADAEEDFNQEVDAGGEDDLDDDELDDDEDD